MAKYKLCEIFELQMGKTPDRHNADFWTKGTEPWISIADLSKCGKYIEKTAESISEEAVAKSGIKIIPSDTVVMSFKLSIGKVAITPKAMYSNEAVMAFISKGVIHIEPTYLYYLLMHHDWEAGTNKAVMGKTLNKATLSEITVNVHEPIEQLAIVRVLDKASAIIDARRQQLVELDNLVKARFVEMFGENVDCPEQAFLEDIAEFVTVGIANSATHAYSDVGIVMLRNQNIKENYLDDADLIHITPEFAEKYGSKQLEENDILVIRTGYPGIACLVPRKYAGCQTFTTLIVRLKNSSRIHANYVCHYINSSFGKEYVESSKVGVAQQNFGAKALSKMPIRIPTIKKQEQFATFVEQTDKSKFHGQNA